MNMTKKQRNLTFAVLLVSSIGTSLLQTALTTALPSIERPLDLGCNGSVAYQCLQPNSGNYGARNGLLDKTFSYQKIIFKCGDSVRGRYVTGNCDAYILASDGG